LRFSSRAQTAKFGKELQDMGAEAFKARYFVVSQVKIDTRI